MTDRPPPKPKGEKKEKPPKKRKADSSIPFEPFPMDRVKKPSK